MEIENFVKEIRKICDEFTINIEDGVTDEVRFSQNSIDLNNSWSSPSYNIFVARGKKTAELSFDSLEPGESQLKILHDMLEIAPENPDFYGINPVKYNYHGNQNYHNVDLYDIAGELIQGSLDGGSEKAAGLAYLDHTRNRIITPWNDQEYYNSGLEIVVRAFRGSNSGQEALHFGEGSMESANPYNTGMAAAKTASMSDKTVSINEGRYDVVFSPYTIGTVLSYNVGFLSYYSINAGLSPFIGKIGKQIASENVTIYDDPLNGSGVGYRPVDEEGTATGKLNLIENGLLKTYMHSYSTGKQSGNQSTGNAGIMDPAPWQLHMSPGNSTPEDMIGSIKSGLFINNAWYTRFQDESNGIFSTVPRDGVFLIKDGDIAGNVSGIRISDSILNILKNVVEVSREEKYVKWWDEIAPSIMPYAMVKNVNITKGF